MSDKNYYLTTTLPYVNAKPHIGFGLEIVQADALARYHRLLGENVIFNFGTDEHGQKIYQKALSENREPQEYVDEYAKKFDELKTALNLSYNHFIRTTDEKHIKAAKEFWRLCDKNGDIYKKNYKSKYCVGCELEKTDSELVDGKCPLHLNREMEIREEENYFFAFSKYQQQLLDFYKANPDFVKPKNKYLEIVNFVENGLKDFSISRLKEKMPWGIEVPGDPDHVMYVWFDALINYISTLGWPEGVEFADFWPGHQVAGKDNLRQQTAIWQAMLMSAGITNSKQIFIHGFIGVDGQKMSKSIGNVVDPVKLADEFGTDAVRYFLLSKIHPWKDSDFTHERFLGAYNDDLANGLGNLVARVAKMAELSGLEFPENIQSLTIGKDLQKYRFDRELDNIWEKIGRLDTLINESELWRDTANKKNVLTEIVTSIKQIATDLQPFLPETADKIKEQFKGSRIKSREVLFPRLK